MAFPITYATYSASTGLVTTSAGLATTFTGLVLTNPINSPVQLQLTSVTILPVVAQTAALQVGLSLGFNGTTAVTQTTPITPASNLVLGPQQPGKGLAASAATLPTATILGPLITELETGAITTVPVAGIVYPVNIVISPGGYVATYTSAASVASSLAFSFTWQEG